MSSKLAEQLLKQAREQRVDLGLGWLVRAADREVRSSGDSQFFRRVTGRRVQGREQ